MIFSFFCLEPTDFIAFLTTVSNPERYFVASYPERYFVLSCPEIYFVLFWPTNWLTNWLQVVGARDDIAAKNFAYFSLSPFANLVLQISFQILIPRLSIYLQP